MESDLLLEFLRFLLTAGGTGVATYGTMEELKRVWPTNWRPLSGDAKFYTAWALSFAFPLAAYLLMHALFGAALTWDGVFAAFAAGYLASQKLYRDTQNREVGA